MASDTNLGLDVSELMHNIFNYNVLTISKLSGYDDMNFVIQARDVQTSEIGKYVLKIVNEADSRRHKLTESIMTVLSSLPTMSYLVPKPIQCKDGRLVGCVSVDGMNRNVVLLTYLCGLNHKQLQFSVDSYVELCHSVGLCAGVLLSHLFDLKNISPLPSRLDDIYMTENLHYSKNKLEFVECSEIRTICCHVMDIVENMANLKPPLRKSLIHHDLCLENLIFQEDSQQRYSVVGAIDFSDMNFGYSLFDAAIPIASAMYQAYILGMPSLYVAGRSVYDGFQRNFSLNFPERDFLYYAALARFVSLRVVGGYDVMQSHETAEHEEHATESLDYLIKLLWSDGKKKFDEEIIGLPC